MQIELKSMSEVEKAETDMCRSVVKNMCQTVALTAVMEVMEAV